MKISEILKNKSTISFEVFPPKNKEGNISSIYSTIEGLAKLSPDFISVTYGAGGSTKGKTVEIASVIKHEYGIESVAHLSCISSTKEDIKYECERLKEAGIDNILALRGDYPADATNFDPENLEFHYASELNEFIGEHFKGQFCLSGACYPETHQEADGFKKDLEALKKKVDAGAEYLVTQIFFDNDYYYRLVREARKIGITVPILAGIMPITNAKSLIRTTKMCGCTIPYQLSTMIEAHYDNPEAMKEIGIIKTITGAMNQAFFTLSLGIGAMSIFGSYIGKERSLLGESLNIALLDTFVAITSGLIIFPACFTFHVDQTSGPGLIFITLPNIFNHIPMGKLWGSLFFIFMSFAAFSTILAVFENIISCGMELTGWSRKKSSFINAIAIILLSVPCVLGYNLWSWDGFAVFGGAVLDFEDFLVSNLFLPLGSLVYLLFCTSRYGWGWKNFTTEANTGKGLKIQNWMRGYISYILPLIVLFIFFFGLYDKF